MEVATRDHFAGVGEDQRIVGDSVRFHGECIGCLTQEVKACTHHLRLTAQAIRILHAVIVDKVRRPDRAAGYQLAQSARHLDLATMPAQRLDTTVERPVGAPRRIG